MPTKPKKWTVLVYLAGDLDTFGLTDLAEMKQIGSTDQINVVASSTAPPSVPTNRDYLCLGTPLTRKKNGW